MLPLTPSYITSRFGDGAKQLRSGESFVIAHSDKIYKLPISSDHCTRLNILASDVARRQFDFMSMPYGFETIEGKQFFLFRMCQFSPLDVTDAKSLLRNQHCLDRRLWLKGIFDSLHKMHAEQIAHFDIRLSNICYTSSGIGNAVFIDLNRSVDVNYIPVKKANLELLTSKYCGSVMYEVLDEWIEEGEEGLLHLLLRLDYRQLSIMFTLLNDGGYKEKTTPSNLCQSHIFLQNLYDGVFDENDFERFLL